MRNPLPALHRAVISYLVGYAPVMVLLMFLIDDPRQIARGSLLDIANTLGFVWVLCLPYLPLSLLLRREVRERLMGRLAGVREGDEREQVITGHAARATFLLTLALQLVFLAMSLTSVHLVRNADESGLFAVGVGFDSREHLRTTAAVASSEMTATVPSRMELKTWLLPPGAALVLMLLIAVQVLAFRLFSARPYAGTQSFGDFGETIRNSD